METTQKEEILVEGIFIMKGTLKKRIILWLLSLAILMAGVSCGNEEAESVVLQCNGVDITESIYRMYLYEAGSALKSEYVPEYTDEEYAALSQEELDAYYDLLDTFWTTEIDGKMPFEIVKENALENLKVYAFYTKECENNNVAMTEEELRSFTSQMELYHEEYLDEIEGWFGVTKDEYISYLAEMDVFASYVDIQASGISVSENEIKAAFDQHRQTYAEVAVQTVFLKVTEEKDMATQRALAEDIKAKIENGEDVTALVATYSDYAEYEDGSMVVTGTSDLDATLGNGYVAYVLASDENDIAILETDMGYCVVKTVAVNMTDNAAGELEVMLQDEKYVNQVKSIVGSNADFDMVIVDQELYDAIDDVPEILK